MTRATRLVSCCAVIAFLVLPVGSAMAHEEYVVDDEHDTGAVAFLTDAIADPFVVGPLLAGALVVLAAVVGYLVFRPFPKTSRRSGSRWASTQSTSPGSCASPSGFR